MQKNSKIFVAGHAGLLGSAVVRILRQQGFSNLLLKSRHDLDLVNQSACIRFFERERPEYIFVCAAKVGGIQANINEPGDFLYINLCIQNNVIDCAKRFGVTKLLFVGSSCIYPVTAPNPISEKALLTGPFEPSNEGYALAKAAGVKLCQLYRRQYGCDFIVAMPTNLFGANDMYDPNRCHLLPSLIQKVHYAKSVGARQIQLWGTGTPRRDFMLSDECADALLFLMQTYSGVDPINVGTGVDLSVRELAQVTAEALDYPIDFVFDPSKPDGIQRKLLDISRITGLGWQPRVALREAISVTYRDFLEKLSESEKCASL